MPEISAKEYQDYLTYSVKKKKELIESKVRRLGNNCIAPCLIEDLIKELEELKESLIKAESLRTDRDLKRGYCSLCVFQTRCENRHLTKPRWAEGSTHTDPLSDCVTPKLDDFLTHS